jgi:hypothetical protein
MDEALDDEDCGFATESWIPKQTVEPLILKMMSLSIQHAIMIVALLILFSMTALAHIDRSDEPKYTVVISDELFQPVREHYETEQRT